MRVIETGNDSASFKVDDFGLRPALELCGIIDAGKFIADDHDLVGLRMPGIECRDSSVFEDKISDRFHESFRIDVVNEPASLARLAVSPRIVERGEPSCRRIPRLPRRRRPAASIDPSDCCSAHAWPNRAAIRVRPQSSSDGPRPLAPFAIEQLPERPGKSLRNNLRRRKCYSRQPSISIVGQVTQTSVQRPVMRIFFLPVASIAARNPGSSQEFIELRSTTGWPGKTSRSCGQT